MTRIAVSRAIHQRRPSAGADRTTGHVGGETLIGVIRVHPRQELNPWRSVQICGEG